MTRIFEIVQDIHLLFTSSTGTKTFGVTVKKLNSLAKKRWPM